MNNFFNRTVHRLLHSETKYQQHLQKVMDNTRDSVNWFPMHAVSYDNVKIALKSIENDCPLRHNTLPVKMSKLIGNEIIDPTSHIINKSIRESIFPEKMENI